jgi:hypothetical protein
LAAGFGHDRGGCCCSAAAFFSLEEKACGFEPKAARSFGMLGCAPLDRRASHKFAAAAPSEHRARATGKFAQIRTLWKIRSWLKATSLSQAVVTASSNLAQT